MASIDELIDLRKAMERLNERQRFVVQQRFLSPPSTYDAIASYMGVTRERVRQVEQRSIEILKNELEGAGDW